MRDRLTELVRDASAKWYREAVEGTTEKTSSAYIADHLLANGVIVPPCKVGDTVYYLPHIAIFEATVISIEVNYYTNPQLWLTIEYCLFSKHHYKTRIDLMLGKVVFLTREDAEKALAERSAE